MTAIPSEPTATVWSESVRTLREQTLSRRGFRVAVLLVAIAAMSFADLYLTLYYVSTVGMNEGNPLARWVMSYNCPWVLGVWKVLLIAITCGLLYYTRKSRSAELAAWVCCAVLGWLCCQWAAYAERVSAITPIMHQIAGADGCDWVQFDQR